jgi:hypothetical protein
MHTIICKECGKEAQAATPRRYWCSSKCRDKSNNRKRKRPAPPTICSVCGISIHKPMSRKQLLCGNPNCKKKRRLMRYPSIKDEHNKKRRAYTSKPEVKANLKALRDRPASKEKTKLANDAWSSKNPERKIWHAAKNRAKRKGIIFDLTVEDIVIPTTCPVLKIPLNMDHKDRSRWDSPSLDRLIPSIGYVRGNIRIISRRANTLKNNATSEELEKVLEDVRRIEQNYSTSTTSSGEAPANRIK